MFATMFLFSTAFSPMADCPTLDIRTGVPGKGKASVSATVAGGDPKATPVYAWTVSPGKVSGGQGTATIEVQGNPGATVTVSLKVDGYKKCKVEYSGAVTLAAGDSAKCPDLLMGKRNAGAGAGIFAAKTDPVIDGATWNWTVSEGSIASGQGTGQITVEAAAGKEVTATVEVGGGPAGCSVTGSKAITIQ